MLQKEKKVERGSNTLLKCYENKCKNIFSAPGYLSIPLPKFTSFSGWGDVCGADDSASGVVALETQCQVWPESLELRPRSA